MEGYVAMPIAGWDFAVPFVTSVPLWSLDPFALSREGYFEAFGSELCF